MSLMVNLPQSKTDYYHGIIYSIKEHLVPEEALIIATFFITIHTMPDN